MACDISVPNIVNVVFFTLIKVRRNSGELLRICHFWSVKVTTPESVGGLVEDHNFPLFWHHSLITIFASNTIITLVSLAQLCFQFHYPHMFQYFYTTVARRPCFLSGVGHWSLGAGFSLRFLTSQENI